MRLALLSLLAAAAPVPATGAGYDALAYDPQPGAQLPLDAVLRDEAGRAVRLGTLLGGRPAIVALDYLRCPTVCGVTLAGLAQAMTDARIAPGAATVLTLSIDPRETPAEARSAHTDYARRFPAASGWRFATASAPPVRRIADTLGFRYRWEPRLGQYVHSVGVAVIAPDGRVSSYLLGLDPPPAAVARALDAARAGAVAERPSLVRLVCFGGETPGTWTATIVNAVRAGSLALLLSGIGWIVLARRRERA